jgi:hypothetical protein
MPPGERLRAVPDRRPRLVRCSQRHRPKKPLAHEGAEMNGQSQTNHPLIYMRGSSTGQTVIAALLPSRSCRLLYSLAESRPARGWHASTVSC